MIVFKYVISANGATFGCDKLYYKTTTKVNGIKDAEFTPLVSKAYKFSNGLIAEICCDALIENGINAKVEKIPVIEFGI